MYNRNLMITAFLSLSTIVASPNLEGNEGLHRTTSAKTSGAKMLTFTLGNKTATGSDILKDEVIYNSFENGSRVPETVDWLFTTTYNFGLTLGIDDDWDVGLVLPLYADYVEFHEGPFYNIKDASNVDIGDFLVWTKHRLPFSKEASPWQYSAQVSATLNTGNDKNGFVPKGMIMHSKEDSQKVSPYTTGISTLGLGLSMSWLGERIGEDWNAHASFETRAPTGLHIYSVMYWGIGTEYLLSYQWRPFIEYAGETRYGYGIFDDINFITTGVRWLFAEGWSMSVAADFNPTWDAQIRKVVLDYKTTDDRHTDMYMYASHQWALSAVVSYRYKIHTDSDRDGVWDDIDQCPNTRKGLKVDDKGCPHDKDKDGVIDEIDKCPDTRLGAPVKADGCDRDSDGDGVVDLDDQCEATAQGVPVDSLGCPKDTDGDGVKDYADKCPHTLPKAPVDTTGCALDTDKDGVIDLNDKCPQTAEGIEVTLNGCAPDSDKDGVPDYKDACAMTILGVEVDAKGCPKDDKHDLSKLRKGIEFKTGSAILLTSSYPTLDKVAELLNEFKEVLLEVQGHTDSSGRSAKNLKLSQARAESVYNYLVKKGISAYRLKAKGYGSKIPVADNKTSEGRAQNRRVELVPFDK